jgi:hypothetical protein
MKVRVSIESFESTPFNRHFMAIRCSYCLIILDSIMNYLKGEGWNLVFKTCKTCPKS